jgi:hypothetical protein
VLEHRSVSVAGQAGNEAQQVAHVGKAGWQNWNVVRHAAEGDFYAGHK